QRGIGVSYETIRRWCRKFGQSYANQLKHSLACADDKWHLEEVRIVINGEVHWLWRAVNQQSLVLDILVQKRRHKRAAKRFFQHLLAGQGFVPRVLVTDNLRSYGTARREDDT
ncbi:MAG: DDE-type integrase/transposase/recombinase, partial [Cyanobacteria bacterium J06555_12]